MWVANAEAAGVAVVFASPIRAARARHHRVSRAARHAWHHEDSRDDSLGVRGLGCMDLDLDVTVDAEQVLGPVDGGFPLAMWALQGGRVAIAAQALGIGARPSIRRSRTRNRASSSASRSPATRRFSS